MCLQQVAAKLLGVTRKQNANARRTRKKSKQKEIDEDEENFKENQKRFNKCKDQGSLGNKYGLLDFDDKPSVCSKRKN